jgi:hypothetical protein
MTVQSLPRLSVRRVPLPSSQFMILKREIRLGRRNDERATKAGDVRHRSVADNAIHGRNSSEKKMSGELPRFVTPLVFPSPPFDTPPFYLFLSLPDPWYAKTNAPPPM